MSRSSIFEHFNWGMLTFLINAACGGLIVKALSESAQSKATAWIMVGQLGGGALSAALILWLAARLPISAVGVCLAAVVALPGLLSFTIPEPSSEPSAWFQVAFLKSAKYLRSYAHLHAGGVRCFSLPRVGRAQHKACRLQSSHITAWGRPESSGRTG